MPERTVEQGRDEKRIVGEIWEWINRDVDEGFWEMAGKYEDADIARARFNEIPDILKPLAWLIICTAIEFVRAGKGRSVDRACLRFRIVLYDVVRKLESENEGLDYNLPYYWFCDGVMIKPEWMVKITNGLLGWVCDSSRERCGMMGGLKDAGWDTCRFRDDD
jgi:hypothetical protein